MRVRINNKKRGAALVEYGLLVAGVALVTAVAISIFGHKVNDMVGTAAAVLPSNDTEDTGAITGGRVVETQGGGIGGSITIGDNPEDSTMEDMFGVPVDELIDDTQNP
jgi:Flp pilus assembly pilin Flp